MASKKKVQVAQAPQKFPWTGRITPWSAALRNQPVQNPRGTYRGILADLPRDTRVTVFGRAGGWLQVRVALGTRVLKGYVSQELIEYLSPELTHPTKVAQFRSDQAAGDWTFAAMRLNEIKSNDEVQALMKELSGCELAYLKQAALIALPRLHVRLTRMIDRLNPAAGTAGKGLADAWCKLEDMRAQFQVDVVPREKWGASPPDKSKGWDEYPKNVALPLYRIVVHHTADPLGQTVKALQVKEMKANYADLPYHFVITHDGAINEGRPMDVVGAHAGAVDNNKDIKKDPDYGSVGIVLTGDFESRMANGWSPDKPTAKQLQSLQRLVNHLVQTYAIPAANIVKHSEVRRDGSPTKCPGEHLSPHVDKLKGTVKKTLENLAAAEKALAELEQKAAKLP